MDELRQRIVEEAKTWLGVPYRHAGRNRQGIDCAGLVIKVGHGCDLGSYDTKNYPKRPNAHDFLREMREHLREIKKDDIQGGDVGMFREPRHPCHTAVMEHDPLTGTWWRIHSYALARMVIREPMNQKLWDSMFKAFAYIPLEEKG